jgi:hypothetical protein
MTARVEATAGEKVIGRCCVYCPNCRSSQRALLVQLRPPHFGVPFLNWHAFVPIYEICMSCGKVISTPTYQDPSEISSAESLED